MRDPDDNYVDNNEYTLYDIMESTDKMFAHTLKVENSKSEIENKVNTQRQDSLYINVLSRYDTLKEWRLDVFLYQNQSNFSKNENFVLVK